MMAFGRRGRGRTVEVSSDVGFFEKPLSYLKQLYTSYER
jgi:hypothetical protein